MAHLNKDNIAADLVELKELIGSVKSDRIKTTLKQSMKSCEAQLKLIEETEKTKEAAQQSEANNSPLSANTSASKASSRVEFKDISTYGWDQSNKNVTVYVNDLKGVGSIPKENISCEFNEKSFDLKIIGLNGSNYRLLTEKLEMEINPSKCKTVIKADRMRIVLSKKQTPKNWMNLVEKKQKKAASKSKKPNTDDPSAGIMDLMKNLYEDGDDEMKRTIAKAWTENREKGNTGGAAGLDSEFGM